MTSSRITERSCRRRRFLRTARPTRRPTANATFGGSAGNFGAASGTKVTVTGPRRTRCPRRNSANDSRSRTRQITPIDGDVPSTAGCAALAGRHGSTSGGGIRAASHGGDCSVDTSVSLRVLGVGGDRCHARQNQRRRGAVTIHMRLEPPDERAPTDGDRTGRIDSTCLLTCLYDHQNDPLRRVGEGVLRSRFTPV